MEACDVARHDEYMRRALTLARRGRGRVEPNPMVGCVVVKRGRIIGEGWHRRFGGPHAEVDALARCTESPRGATLYVTLEPCSYHGQTPPCADAVITAGVKRVVAATRDPNPRVSGRGLRKLRAAGIAVVSDVLRSEADELIAPFRQLITTRRPWIILKWAQSLDGKIATRTGDSKWISDDACRAHAHRVRSYLDGIVVGAETVRTDDPLLTCRVGRPRRVATRIVLDSRLRTTADAQLIRTAREVPTLFFCTTAAAARRQRALRDAGCEVVALPPDAAGQVAIADVVGELGRRRMTRVLVEGGGAVLGAFLDAGLANEVHAYLAPRLIGGAAATPAFGGRGAASVVDSATLRDPRWRRVGNGLFLSARLDAGAAS
jgi:diaminohydroxyphosphoribosylaminopyrimidine deaminase/5-amino-6-(5-phosphoribosylamino)uracil reductase